MPLVTTARKGLVDQVIAQMRELVSSGEWPLGSRIPPEAELVTALGVGRNTVREAVRALAHAGLLEVRQGDGTRVRATNELSGAVRRLCGSELRRVLEVRRALEVEAARLAATARTPDDVRDLESKLDQRDQAILSSAKERVIRTDAEFHLRLVQASHNPVLIELYEGISEAVRDSVASTYDPKTSPEDENVSHTELVTAVRDGAPDRAAAEAGGFLDVMLDRLSKTDDQSGTSSPDPEP